MRTKEESLRVMDTNWLRNELIGIGQRGERTAIRAANQTSRAFNERVIFDSFLAVVVVVVVVDSGRRRGRRRPGGREGEKGEERKGKETDAVGGSTNAFGADKRERDSTRCVSR